MGVITMQWGAISDTKENASTFFVMYELIRWKTFL